MITDERLDQLVRQALDWHADRATARQPALTQQVARLATRIGPASMQVIGRVTLAPAGLGTLRMLTLIVLMLGLLVAAIVIGALLLRDPTPPRLPFGFARDCGQPFETGDVLSFGVLDEFVQVHEGGALVSNVTVGENPDGSELTRRQYVETASYRERRLTPAGVARLQQRVADLGLSPGCARVRTADSSGAVFTRGTQGITGITWSPLETQGSVALVRRATQTEEHTLSALAADLANLDEWLPADAWIAREESLIKPNKWLVYLTLTASVRDSQAFSRIVLPGRVDPASFGESMDVDPFGLAGALSSRCGVLDRAEALALADSIDALRPRPAWLGLSAAIPSEADCPSLVAQVRQNQQPTDAPPQPEGEFAAVKPCEWVPMAAADDLTSAAARLIPRQTTAFFGEASPMCDVADSAVMGSRATVILHTRTVSDAEAATLAADVLGGAAVEMAIAGSRVWRNDCLTQDLNCWWGIAASKEPYFIVVAIDARRQVRGEAAHAFVEAVLDQIPD